MRIVIKKGDKVISEPVPMDDVIQKPIRRVMKNNFAVTINRPGNHVKEEKHSPHWDKSAQRAPHGEGGLPRSELRCVTFVLLPDLFLPRLLGDKEWDSLEAAYPLTS